MTIDTSMYNGLLQKPKSIAEYDAERMQLQQAQQQNRLADLVYGEKQREIGGDNALANLLSGGKTGADVSQGLAAAGYGNKAMAYTKTLQEQKERDAKISNENATAEEKRIKAAQARIDAAGQTFKFVKDSPTAENAYAAIDYLTRNGVYNEEQAAAHRKVVDADPSPANVAKLADMAFRAALAAKEQLPKIETIKLGGTTDTLSIDPVTGKTKVINSAKNTMTPGEIAADAREKARLAQSERHFQVSQASGKIPAGYRANPDGSLSFIPGGPADPKSESGKAPTEFQGKSAAFGARAEASDKILSRLEKDGVMDSGIIKSVAEGVGSAVPFFGDKLGPALGSGVNMLPGVLGGPNAKQQQVEQARRDFVNAVLRQESGAAIGQSEFDNAARQYFPQPGDTKEVIAQKASNRKLAIEGFKRNAGRAAFSGPDQASAGDIHSQADAILRGGK